MRSCERPLKRSASEALPSSVSNRYSLSIRTHGSSCRRCASSSLRRVSSFSASSSSSRAASHSLRVPVMCFVIALLLPSIRPDGRWSWDTFSAGYRNGGSDKCDGIPMDSMITAAARALAAGDLLGALNRVALRDDPPALALRGIAMARLGDLVRAKTLLQSAARAFGPKEAMARARCVVAEVESASLVLSTPAARLIARGEERPLLLDEVEALLASEALVVDACRHVVRTAGIVVSLATRPVLFALARALGEAWPADASRAT